MEDGVMPRHRRAHVQRQETAAAVSTALRETVKAEVPTEDVKLEDLEAKVEPKVEPKEIPPEDVLHIESNDQDLNEVNIIEESAMDVSEEETELEVIIVGDITPEDVLHPEDNPVHSDEVVDTVEDSMMKLVDLKGESEVEVIIVEDDEPGDTENIPNHDVNITEDVVLDHGLVEENVTSVHLDKRFLFKPQESISKCAVCQMPLRTKEQLDRHYRRCHPEVNAEVNTFMCETCGKVYKTEAAFRKHNFNHLDAGDGECATPELKKSDTSIKQERSYSDLHAFMCDTCGNNFKSDAAFRRHRLKHVDISAIEYEIEELKTSITSLDHTRSYSDVHAFMCVTCGDRFKTLSMLQSHEAYHRSVLDCDRCPKAYKSSKDLKLHKKVCHSVPGYVCDYCNRGFTFKSDIGRHLQNNGACKNDNLKYTCPTCKIKFEKKSKWITHHYNTHKEEVRREDHEEDLEVQINGMKFTYLGVLNTYDHTIRTYKCKVCKKGYSKYPQLYQHYTKHWKERPYTCSICNRGFYYRTVLKKHFLVHQKKPYNCDICEMSFATSEERQQHATLAHSSKIVPPPDFTLWRTALEGTLHKCDVCENVFATKDAKEQHKRRAHSNKRKPTKPRVAVRETHI